MADRSMRAVVQSGYGDPRDVLRVRRVPVPTVGPDQVLVAVRAASVHPDVWHVVRGWPRVLRVMGSGLRRPSPPVPGTDMAGDVVAVGSGVTRFAPGDHVFGETISGLQWRNGAAFAEYVAVAEEALASTPPTVTAEQAATLPTAGLIVLANLPDLDDPEWPRRVLVNGAVALQVAKSRGAHVTAVEHPSMLALVARATRDDTLPSPSLGAPDRRRSMQWLHDLLADGSLTPVVARTFPLEQAADALATLAAGSAPGRIVLVP